MVAPFFVNWTRLAGGILIFDVGLGCDSEGLTGGG